MKEETLFALLSDIDEAHIAQAHGQKKTPRTWVKWAAVACLCLVAAAFAIPRLLGSPAGPQLQPDAPNVIQVNTVEGMGMADILAKSTYYDKLSAPKQYAMRKQFKAATGLNYQDFTAKIPAFCTNLSFYSVDVPVDPAIPQYVPHDYVFRYQGETGGMVTIALCGKEAPLRDVILICEDPLESQINGIPVIIYGTINDYFARFSWKNVYYDIQTRNFTIEQLEQLLEGILS